MRRKPPPLWAVVAFCLAVGFIVGGWYGSKLNNKSAIYTAYVGNVTCTYVAQWAYHYGVRRTLWALTGKGTIAATSLDITAMDEVFAVDILKKSLAAWESSKAKESMAKGWNWPQESVLYEAVGAADKDARRKQR